MPAGSLVHQNGSGTPELTESGWDTLVHRVYQFTRLVEHVARVRLAPRGPAQEEGELAVGLGWDLGVRMCVGFVGFCTQIL